MALDETERRIVAVIEENWMGYARLTSPRTIAESFSISEIAASKLLQRENVREALNSRGIPQIEGAGLSPDQVTAINVVVNPIDTRSRTKKLQEMSISPSKWSGWLKQPNFKEFLAQRSTDLLNDAIPEAHMALVDNVMRGDFQSIKFLYEMTGHYDSNKSGVDIPSFLNRVFDIISEHVKNPQVLLAIANELQGLAGGGNLNSSRPPEVVQGELTQGEVISDNLAEHLDLSINKPTPVARSVTQATIDALLDPKEKTRQDVEDLFKGM